MSVKNIESAFRTPGIYPTDLTRYPIKEFNPNLYQLYIERRALHGMPPSKPATPSVTPLPTPSKNPSTSVSTQTPHKQPQAPTTPSILEERSSSCSTMTYNESFEQLLADEIRQGRNVRSTPAATKKPRRMLDVGAKVLTAESFIIELQEKQKKVKEANEAKEAKRKKKQPKKVQAKKLKTQQATTSKTVEESESDSDENPFLLCSPIASSTSDEDALSASDCEASFVTIHFQARLYEKMLNGSTSVKSETYYMVAYGSDLSYIGKVVKIDTDQKVTMKFMNRLPEETFDWHKVDKIEQVDLQQLICGPINIRGSLPFHISGIPKAMKDYNAYKKEQLSKSK